MTARELTTATVPHRFLLVLLAALAAGLFAGSARAQTLVPAQTFTSNVTFDLAGSPWIIDGDVHILNDAVLTINPSVVVKFSPGTSIVVQTGRVVAEAAFAQIINITSDDISNRGQGFRIVPGSGGSASFKYCDITQLNFAVQIQCCGVPGPFIPAVIEDCAFNNNLYAVQGYAGGSQAQWSQITRCIFVQNQYAIDSADKIVSDCDFYSNNEAISNIERMTIEDCDFQGNTTAISTPGNNYSVEVARCNIQNNINGIVRAPNTRRCTIANNQVGVTMTSPAILECNDIYQNDNWNLRILTNTSLNVANNWWGTSIATQIEAGIEDGLDQVGLGFALYGPQLPGDWSTTSTCQCTIPSVSLQPQNQTVYDGDTATFTVVASFVGAPSYQWRRNGVNLPNWSPRFGFSNTPTLTINPVATPGSEPTWTDAGQYDCVITNVCGTAISNPATLTVTICGADYDNNGIVTTADIFAFLSAWFSGCP